MPIRVRHHPRQRLHYMQKNGLCTEDFTFNAYYAKRISGPICGQVAFLNLFLCHTKLLSGLILIMFSQLSPPACRCV